MSEYRRRLPHRDTPAVPIFLTWRLHGSLPPERIFHREHIASGKVFAIWDRLLDRNRSGPQHLAHPQIASLVQNHLKQSPAHQLHAYVILPNHVHVLCTPTTHLASLMRHLKGPTARAANQLLGLSGQPLWQQEYFDRTVRNQAEFSRIWEYIESNPVKAGLATAPEDFPWSSAAELKLRAG